MTLKGQIKMKTFSLRSKITGSFLAVLLFSSIGIGYYAYHQAVSNIESAVGDTALSIIQSIVSKIDAGEFVRLQSPSDMQSDAYRAMQSDLNSIREATGLRYLYTMRQTEPGAYVYVVDGTPMGDEDFSSLGDPEEEISKTMIDCFQGVTGYELGSDEWGSFISAYIPIKDASGSIVGILGADFEASKMVSQLEAFKKRLDLIILSVILLGLFLGEGLSIILVRSLNRLKAKAERIQNGDLTVTFEKTGSDEIGVLTRTFENMTGNLVSLTHEIKNNTKTVVSEISNLYLCFSEAEKAAEEISHVITGIADGTSQQTRRMDEVSGSMNEVFEQVKKSAEHADLVSESSEKASANAVRAMDIFKTSMEKVMSVNRTVDQTALIIQALGEKSKEISSFSDTISKITRQTNLLSLNAAIEAARAGEHGKGFAVVADEVKALAGQSDEASKQIGEIAVCMQTEIDHAIQAIREGAVQANEGVSAVQQVDVYLGELQNSSLEVSNRARVILEAISRIEEACRGAVQQVHELDDISKRFSAGSRQAASSIEEQTTILQQINGNIDAIKQTTYCLSDVVNKFKIEEA